MMYSSCRDCGETLIVTDGDTVHPLCLPKPTSVEQLAAQWLQAVEHGDDQRAGELQHVIDDIDGAPPRLLDAALVYAAWGWPVFPLRPLGKTPATKHGFKDASTDPAEIREWWDRMPQANIGLPTGIKFDVVDIDVPAGAYSYVELMRRCDPSTGRGPLPDFHGQVATASGGIHFYVERTGEGNTVGIMPGIDHRGKSGYVVGPPSTLSSTPGRSWSWTVKPSPTLIGRP